MLKNNFNIIKASKDRSLFRDYLSEDSLQSFSNWFTVLRCIYGIGSHKRKARELIKLCTGRNPDLLNADGYKTSLLLVGRRGGKSKISGLMAAYAAAISGREKKLSRGERACCTIVSPTRIQSKIVKEYTRAALSSPLLEQEIIQEDKEGFELSNGVRIQILTGHFKNVRGFSQIFCCIEEAAFFCVSEESSVKNASELISSIRPGLLNSGGKLIVISTKYRKSGWCFQKHQKNFKNNKGKVFVWEAPSLLMNPELDEDEIADIVEEDPASGASEFYNKWREDLEAYISIEIIQACVSSGRVELLPRNEHTYFGFVDVSGGRIDDAALCISHLRTEKHQEPKVEIDCLKRYKSPHSPAYVVEQMCVVLKKYNLRECTGDFYSANWVVDAFKSHGITYNKSDKNKSQLFLEVLPRLCSGGICLVDIPEMCKQFSNLERRTHSGGRDTISHPSGSGHHDDLCNAVAGASYLTIGNKMKRIGVFL